MPERRLELLWVTPLAPKASASTNFATPACILGFSQTPRCLVEAWAGIEPAHGGFADRSVTTSPPRLLLLRRIDSTRALSAR